MKLKIACAQVSAQDDMEQNVIKGLDFLAKAAEQGVQIACYPEMSFCRFFPQYHADTRYFDQAETIPGLLVDRFREACKKHKIAAVINMYEKGGPGRYFDCSPVIGSDGELLGKSQMMHIAELPNYNEKYYYWEGRTGYPVFEDRGVKFGIAICYDRHYPEQMRALTLKGAEVIFVPTATSLSELKTIWEIEMQAASVANQVFIAVANRTGKDDKIEFFGKSFVTAPDGEILAMAGESREELLVVEIDTSDIEKTRRKLPFLRDRRPETYDDLIDLDY
ncbi:carbon-nitrogen hydrolase family protein [candidate division KSB1 bacterium]